MQGHLALEEQTRQVAAALESAFTIQLGGSEGAGHQWGKCLGVRADGDLSQIRSTVGNALAQASVDRGLQPIGVVAYVEVHRQSGCAGGPICSTRPHDASHAVRVNVYQLSNLLSRLQHPASHAL